MNNLEKWKKMLEDQGSAFRTESFQSGTVLIASRSVALFDSQERFVGWKTLDDGECTVNSDDEVKARLDAETLQFIDAFAKATFA